MGFPGGVSAPVERSYEWCRVLAKERAKNFYYSFALLSRPQHDAMCAVYAFMRVCDDLSDGPGLTVEQRRAALADWRRDLDLAMGGLQTMPAHPVWLALYDSVLKFRIPRHYFHEMIDGVSSDLEFKAPETFEEVYRYCYLVASIVGLVIIHIFGFKGPEALPLAEKCGVAFQLTNIIRDVKEDAENGRVYLPAEDLRRFGVTAQMLMEPAASLPVKGMLRFEMERAQRFYDEARPLIGMVDRRSQASLRALIEIYETLLERIRARDGEVFGERVALTKWEKIWILVKNRFAR